MTTKCIKCGVRLEEGEPQQNGLCIDCFAEEWGELVEISPIVSPRFLLESGGKKEKEDLKQVRGIIEDLWMDTYGITGKEVTTIAKEIDEIFHKEGHNISHDKINHFVVDVIRKK